MHHSRCSHAARPVAVPQRGAHYLKFDLSCGRPLSNLRSILTHCWTGHWSQIEKFAIFVEEIPCTKIRTKMSYPCELKKIMIICTNWTKFYTIGATNKNFCCNLQTLCVEGPTNDKYPNWLTIFSQRNLMEEVKFTCPLDSQPKNVHCKRKFIISGQNVIVKRSCYM